MIYGKKDAVMTRGMAILSMVCLHLFCRLGNDIVFTPLIWVNSEKPFTYWIGFFCEICVPLYSMCAGYAQYLLYQQGKTGFKNNGKRILKLLKNYWIILTIFCILGLFFDKQGQIPGSIGDFLKSIVLLHSYNGAWWYLNTYIILLLIPAFVLMFPVKKINSYVGIVLCFGLTVVWYLLRHFLHIDDFTFQNSALEFIRKEIFNLVHVLPFYWIGAFVCKGSVFDNLDAFIEKSGKRKWINFAILIGLALIFVITNVLEKAVLIYPVALIMFLAFNILKKPKFVEKAFLFLGKHSTNIWLTHMFFYAILFKDLVWIAKYPVLIVLFMLVLCIATSYVEMLISFGVDKITALFKVKTNESV